MTTEFEFVEPERMSWEQQKERMKKKTRELLERLMQPHSPLAFEPTIWLSLSACLADRMNGTDRNQNIKKKSVLPIASKQIHSFYGTKANWFSSFAPFILHCSLIYVVFFTFSLFLHVELILSNRHNLNWWDGYAQHWALPQYSTSLFRWIWRCSRSHVITYKHTQTHATQWVM